MTARAWTYAWIVLPLIGLAAVLLLRWHIGDNPEVPVPTPAAPEAVETPSQQVIPSPEPAQPSPVEVCPSQLMQGFATDYSGTLMSRVSTNTLVKITCGPDVGTYELYVVDLANIMDEPDLYLESCSDPYCQGAYGILMLERM